MERNLASGVVATNEPDALIAVARSTSSAAPPADEEPDVPVPALKSIAAMAIG